MKRLAREWIRKAEEDFAVAQREMRARTCPAYGAICFHAQQCAEKYFKARLCEGGKAVTKTHDLPTLLTELATLDASLQLLDPAARVLVDFAVRYRYPGAWASRAVARTALNHAKLIRETMRRTMGLAATTARKSRGGGARQKTSRGRTRKRK